MAGFLEEVIGETAEFAAAFKPNIAYFEAMGSEGMAILESVLGQIPDGIPVVLDAKRGDIGTTAEHYARACFEVLGADAVTLNPYMGRDTIEPFLAHEGRGVYLLGVTSNPGSRDLQRQRLGDGRDVFELVAEMAADLPETGLVVGLTNAGSEVLKKIPDVPLLIPGLGAQGGDLGALAGQGRQAPLLVNVSRGILYADPDQSFARKARYYRDEIARVL